MSQWTAKDWVESFGHIATSVGVLLALFQAYLSRRDLAETRKWEGRKHRQEFFDKMFDVLLMSDKSKLIFPVKLARESGMSDTDIVYLLAQNLKRRGNIPGGLPIRSDEFNLAAMELLDNVDELAANLEKKS